MVGVSYSKSAGPPRWTTGALQRLGACWPISPYLRRIFADGDVISSLSAPVAVSDKPTDSMYMSAWYHHSLCVCVSDSPSRALFPSPFGSQTPSTRYHQWKRPAWGLTCALFPTTFCAYTLARSKFGKTLHPLNSSLRPRGRNNNYNTHTVRTVTNVINVNMLSPTLA